MQKCSKCGKKMEPKIELNGSAEEILKRLAADQGPMHWACPTCRVERSAPMKAADVEDVAAFVRRKKKQWWQFWIR